MIQRQRSANLRLDVAYVGSHALRLPYDPENNRVDRLTGLRPVAGFGAFNYYQTTDSSNYNSLQTSVQKRFSRDLTFDGAYTWASNTGYFRGDMHCCGGGEQAQELNDLRSNHGPRLFLCVMCSASIGCTNYPLRAFGRAAVAPRNFCWGAGR